MKYFILIYILFFSSCITTKISVVNGRVFRKEKIIRLNNKPDTTYYVELYNGDIITEKEFDKRWDRALRNAKKKIERQIKN